jgi:hypothetical protein
MGREITMIDHTEAGKAVEASEAAEEEEAVGSEAGKAVVGAGTADVGD